MQFADEVPILLKMGNLRAKNTGSELVRNTQATSSGRVSNHILYQHLRAALLILKQDNV